MSQPKQPKQPKKTKRTTTRPKAPALGSTPDRAEGLLAARLDRALARLDELIGDPDGHVALAAVRLVFELGLASIDADLAGRLADAEEALGLSAADAPLQ